MNERRITVPATAPHGEKPPGSSVATTPVYGSGNGYSTLLQRATSSTPCLKNGRTVRENGAAGPSVDPGVIGVSLALLADVCPYNVKFAQALKVPEFAPREVLASNDARTIAREVLAMTQEEFSVAFKGSPVKRAKPRGLKLGANVSLENIGNSIDVDVLSRALDDREPLVCEHAAWVLEQIASRPR